jgi:predicted ATP-binding protein involved in virulence
MIKVKKGRQPNWLNRKVAKDIKEDLRSYYKINGKERAQSRPPHDIVDLLNQHCLNDLREEFNNKCAYCETKFTENNSDQIQNRLVSDLYRPEANAIDMNGTTSTNHYWWLALDWKNVLLACQECTSNKRNYFPVARKRANHKFKSKTELREFEDPYLLDPTSEQVQKFFMFDFNSGLIMPLSERAEITVKILGLNRFDLIDNRKRVRRELDKDIAFLNSDVRNISNSIKVSRLSKIAEKWDRILSLDNTLEHQGLSYKYLMLKHKDGLIEFSDSVRSTIDINKLFNSLLSIDNYEANVAFSSEYNYELIEQNFLDPLHLESIKIKNFKSIIDLEIVVPRIEKYKTSCIGLIGENGAGKSSILQAILKTILGRSIDYARITTDDIRIKANYCFTEVRFRNKKGFISCNFDREKKKSKWIWEDYYVMEQVIMAFGPYRHSQDSGGQERSFNEAIWAHNFFKPYAPLRSASKWLYTLSDKDFDNVAKSILDMLLLTNKATLDRSNDEIWVLNNEKISLDQLSDGYKSMISLACNIMEGLYKVNQDIRKARAIVVIDELGANLHPKWKMRIMKRLRNTFPFVQFIVSTHDPLCLKGFEQGEVFLVKENDEGNTQLIGDLPSTDEYRVDELLTSPMFGLSTTIDPEIEAEMIEYYDLLGKEKLDINQKNRLNKLKVDLKQKNHLGDTYRENLLYFAIDMILAKSKKERKFNQAYIEKEVAQKAIELIEKYNIF